MAIQKIKLGQEVKDKVTGYQGIAFSITDYIQGCRRVGIQAKMKEDGSIPDEYCFDEPMLEVVGNGILLPSNKEPTGGPRGISINRR